MTELAAAARDAPACLEALPVEILLAILHRAFPRVDIPPHVARHDPEDFRAELERCVGLARLSRVSKRWCQVCDEASDLFLRFDGTPRLVRRRTTRVHKVIVEVTAGAEDEHADLPAWLPPLVAAGATLVVSSVFADGFPHGMPVWTSLGRCNFGELVLLKAGLRAEQVMQYNRSSGHLAETAFKTVRHLRFDVGCSQPLAAFARNLATLQVPLEDVEWICLSGVLTPQVTALHAVKSAGILSDSSALRGARLSWSTPAHLKVLSWGSGHTATFASLWLQSRRLQEVTVGREAMTDALLSHVASLLDLSSLRLVRHADTPANEHRPDFWTFDVLAEQVARLLCARGRQGDAGRRRLRIEVAVEGTLRKYDVAQRSAREAFCAATSVLVAGQEQGLEVWLSFPSRCPYRAFPPPLPSPLALSTDKAA